MTTPRTAATTLPSTSLDHGAARRGFTRRISTETKSSWKTTEFWIYIAVVVGILIAAQTVGSDSSAANGGNAGDYFRADKAWLYIVIATVGYLVSRGLAKSGSRDFYDDRVRDRDDD
jgi:H+/Cl- antiporter ClcA